MSTVIYLANQQIQVVEGTVTKTRPVIKRYFGEMAPEGSIINGIVMDTDLFIPFIREMWATQHFADKDVILVVNSSKFVGRSMDMPPLTGRRVVEFIGREYADMGRDEEMVYSYIPLGASKAAPKPAPAPQKDAKDGGEKKKKPAVNRNLRIYVEASEPDFIKDYIDIFSHAGVKLSAIYSGECTLITFAGREAAKRFRTFVLLVADLMTFSTVLWVDGEFSYYNSTRCFHDPDTPEYAADLARSMSQLTQFMQANGIEHPLECIEIAGVNPDNRQMYETAIRELGINTPVEVFSLFGGGLGTDWTLQYYLHPVSGLYDAGKAENFLTQYHNMKKPGSGVSSAGKKVAIAIGALFLVMVIIVSVLFATMLGKQAKVEELKEFNTSPSVAMQLMDFEKYSVRNAFLRAQKEAIKDVEEDIYTYPLGDTQVLEVFDKCAAGYAKVAYNAFDAEKGTIAITASAEDVESINKFIKRLMQEDIFSAVNYTGYAFNQKTQLWDIHVTCTLAESAGRKKRADEGAEDAKDAGAAGGESADPGAEGKAAERTGEQP